MTTTDDEATQNWQTIHDHVDMDEVNALWESINKRIVWVVTSDVGLNGHYVHGTFATKPTPEELAMYGHLVSGDTDYQHTRAQPVMLDVPTPLEWDRDNWVYVHPYKAPGP